MGSEKEQVISLLMHEHQMLRQEVQEHIRGVYTSYAAVGTVLVAALAAGFGLWDSNAIASSAIFNIAVPILLVTMGLGLFVVGVTLERIRHYIKTEIEDIVNALLGTEFCNWLQATPPESWVHRLPKKLLGWSSFLDSRYTTPYGILRLYTMLEGMLLFILILMSVLMGEIRILSQQGWEANASLIRFVIAFMPAVIVSFGLVTTYLLWKKAR